MPLRKSLDHTNRRLTASSLRSRYATREIHPPILNTYSTTNPPPLPSCLMLIPLPQTPAERLKKRLQPGSYTGMVARSSSRAKMYSPLRQRCPSCRSSLEIESCRLLDDLRHSDTASRGASNPDSVPSTPEFVIPAENSPQLNGDCLVTKVLKGIGAIKKPPTDLTAYFDLVRRDKLERELKKEHVGLERLKAINLWKETFQYDYVMKLRQSHRLCEAKYPERVRSSEPEARPCLPWQTWIDVEAYCTE
ncbi:hypothetical protein DL98DRAFT_599492 [Cadophora sp. DSE1049]|nr:hypothetical protein DL98DRAFT_599492 [Cadophora sp. DSE1049]